MTVPSKKRPQGNAPDAPAPGVVPRSMTKLLSAIAAPAPLSLDAEWMETDGLGGFASGTISGIRTRREHALLHVSELRQGGGAVLVNGLDVRVMTPRGMFDITSHRYAPDVVHPDGQRRIESFTSDPWPTWLYRMEDGTRVEHQLFAVSGAPGVVLSWSVLDGAAAGVRLMVRPLISGREARALHHENAHFRSEAQCCDWAVRWHPYASHPAILAGSNGTYAHHHLWYHNFLYADDRARGVEYMEDLGSPGIFHFDLSRREAVLILTTDEGLHVMKAGAEARAAGLPGFLGAARGNAGALEALRENERSNRMDVAPRAFPFCAWSEDPA